MGITFVQYILKYYFKLSTHFREEYLRLPSDSIPGIILTAVWSFNQFMIDCKQTNKNTNIEST